MAYFDPAGTTDKDTQMMATDVSMIPILGLFLNNDWTSWLDIQTTVFQSLNVC